MLFRQHAEHNAVCLRSEGLTLWVCEPPDLSSLEVLFKATLSAHSSDYLHSKNTLVHHVHLNVHSSLQPISGTSGFKRLLITHFPINFVQLRRFIELPLHTIFFVLCFVTSLRASQSITGVTPGHFTCGIPYDSAGSFAHVEACATKDCT